MLCALREGGKGSRAVYGCTLSRATMGAGMGGDGDVDGVVKWPR